MKYKAIGFDYGGVIFGRSSMAFNDGAAAIFNVESDKLLKVYFQNNNRLNLGEMTWEELWKHIAVELNCADKQEAIMEFIVRWGRDQKLNLDVVELIKVLKTAGYKIGLLSNYNSGLHQMLEEQKIDNYFDVVGISSEMGVMKPNVEAFSSFCNMLNVQPDELVYIDDTPKSLETSGDVGYTPILFQNFDKLYQDLKNLNIVLE
ncbi:MAG: HAD family hydrolase [Candidatus Moraniibacteriota bacterium]|jgi:HAD superfamily hydrolase (TIGR01549 family)